MSGILKARHRKIVNALVQLGGEATTSEIAEKADLNTNGVAQSLGAPWTENRIESISGDETGGKRRWKLIEPVATLPF